MRLDKKHNLPGTLICVEGIDGSGKSTQLAILRNWLCETVNDVIFTEWNSSRLISQTTKLAKKKSQLSPRTFSLLHAVDFADRLEQTIIPALKAGYIVLADRYVYTAFARDVARGVDAEAVAPICLHLHSGGVGLAVCSEGYGEIVGGIIVKIIVTATAGASASAVTENSAKHTATKTALLVFLARGEGEKRANSKHKCYDLFYLVHSFSPFVSA